MLTTANGFAVAVLPMGLSAFAKTTNRLDSVVEAKQAVLISPFVPSTPYDDRLAEARNILIDHLTMALLIPESDDETQARALAALERGLPVFVISNTAGNRALLDQGALLLTDPGEVVDWVQQALVDAAILESEEEEATASLNAAPLSATAPADAPQSDDDYSLQGEEVPPLDADEALEILSLGGELPEVLRKRLKSKLKDDE
jgi:predicted Rossmann fold nucleotide-binding protein DprA/Smf involved in DNA uptake